MSDATAEFEAPIGAAVAVEIDSRPYRICVTRGAPGHAHVRIIRDPEQWCSELHDSLNDLMAGPAKWLRAI